MEKFSSSHGRWRSAASQQRRHRPDHPRGVAQEGHPRRLRRGTVLGLAQRPDFVLNQDAFKNATVLVAGPDFGTGSSREHAVWALQNYGFKVVISPRFGDIFRGNSGKAGLLAAQVDDKVVQRLWDYLDENPGASITIDLETRTVKAGEGRRRDRGLVHDRRLHPLAPARGTRRRRHHAEPRGRHRRVRGEAPSFKPATL